jgi:hypothetical protein
MRRITLLCGAAAILLLAFHAARPRGPQRAADDPAGPEEAAEDRLARLEHGRAVQAALAPRLRFAADAPAPFSRN